MLFFSFVAVNFDHFQILRAIGKGSFGKVSSPGGPGEGGYGRGCLILMVRWLSTRDASYARYALRQRSASFFPPS